MSVLVSDLFVFNFFFGGGGDFIDDYILCFVGFFLEITLYTSNYLQRMIKKMQDYILLFLLYLFITDAQ